MPKFKVLVNGRFGEGWKVGDIVAMDDVAAAGPLKEGAIKLFIPDETIIVAPTVNSEPDYKRDVVDSSYTCPKCKKAHRIVSKIGQEHLKLLNAKK